MSPAPADQDAAPPPCPPAATTRRPWSSGCAHGLLIGFTWTMLAPAAALAASQLADPILGPDPGGGFLNFLPRNVILGFLAAVATFFVGPLVHGWRATRSPAMAKAERVGTWMGILVWQGGCLAAGAACMGLAAP